MQQPDNGAKTPDHLFDEERNRVDAKFKAPDDKAQVSAEFVYDRIENKHYLRIKFKTIRPGDTPNPISSIDIPADQNKERLKYAAGVAAGALCEKHHDKYGETADPSDAAKAGVDSFLKLRGMVNKEKEKIIVN